MTAMTLTIRTTPTVGNVLGIVHEGWMQQVATFLASRTRCRSDCSASSSAWFIGT